MLVPAEKSIKTDREFWASFPERIKEENVKPYTLPDPLKTFDGKEIRTKEEYLAFRREEVLQFYKDKLYGHIPPPPEIFHWELTREKAGALTGNALRYEFKVTCATKDHRSVSFPVLLYLPQQCKRKCLPVFVMPNFYGNHTVTPEKDIPVSDHWLPFQYRGSRFQTPEMREKFRGSDQVPECEFVPSAEEALRRGYAVATFCYEYMMPDNGYHFEHSIYQLFHNELDYMSENRSYGSICAWAWGISRVLDLLDGLPETAGGKRIVLGHSRLGKTALWAGANDTRIDLTISNNSGCCGAKLFHRDFGENMHMMAYMRPYWFSLGIQEYADREADLPLDQYDLLGLIAPRNVYIASGSEDHGADPKGEFLSAWHAGKIYRLFGLKGLEVPEEFPEAGTTIHNGVIAYHLRKGGHALTYYDWERYLDYADLIFERNRK